MAADGSQVLQLLGDWTLDHGEALEDLLAKQQKTASQIKVDSRQIAKLDSTGAFMVAKLTNGNLERLIEDNDKRKAFIDQIAAATCDMGTEESRHSHLQEIAIDAGMAVERALKDGKLMLTNLGHIMAAFYRVLTGRSRLRFTAIIYHLEYSGLRAVPIVMLMSFLIGGIIAQQAAYQLRFFGAELLTVDLAGILILREIGLLLAAIMFAGRSGSAFTAELGSMKMREEIDALETMGLDPVEVLAVPRVLALVIALPLLTIIANGTAIGGALLVSWVYSGIDPVVFTARLRDVVTVNVFFVGLIKAPIMAIVIGIVAYMEGMKTQGSAESLGQQVTISVVKAIFMVIVLDGVFAILFAAFDF